MVIVMVIVVSFYQMLVMACWCIVANGLFFIVVLLNSKELMHAKWIIVVYWKEQKIK